MAQGLGVRVAGREGGRVMGIERLPPPPCPPRQRPVTVNSVKAPAQRCRDDGIQITFCDPKPMKHCSALHSCLPCSRVLRQSPLVNCSTDSPAVNSMNVYVCAYTCARGVS